MLLQFLPISTLNIADDSFRISVAPQLDVLKASIKAVGIIQPIIVRHTMDGAYQVIAGYKRVLASQALGRQTIPSLVYEHTDLSVLQAFLLNLHDNLSVRKLNIIEMSSALSRMSSVYGVQEDELVRKYLPLMSEEPSYKVLHQLLSLSQCSGPMQELIIEKQYALSTAARIAEFSPTTQDALMQVLGQINATTAKLNELLTMIREIGARDAISVEEVLQRYQLLTIVANPAASQSSKVNALRQTLRGLRLPKLTQRKQQFAGFIQELALPDSAKVSTDPYFEKGKLKLECQFEQPEELEQVINHIQKAFERQTWRKIFDWYQV